ncbi:MAG: phosphatidylserine decarboxylase [Aristaeellaceae bacterium]
MKKLQQRLMIAMVMLLVLCAPLGAMAQEHAPMTESLMTMLEADAQLKTMMEKSLALAAGINPDPATNPAQSLEQLYDFLDWAATCMPWNVLRDAAYPALYEHIDQSVDYFWFLVDQPLEELEGLGYYYPTLQYHEPIASWCREYAQSWGAYLSTEESWKDEYTALFAADGRFGLDKGWYEDAANWHSFNDFFARYLSSPSARPIADAALVAPADSKPQGVWAIDAQGELVHKEGVLIKSARFTSVRQLIGEDSAYADAFAGGTLTHTFLDVNDYHRYHFPVDGTVLEVRKIEGTNAAGGITRWDAESGRYVLEDTIPGWQMIETRDCVILDTDYGLVAILPIGMSQICSCNWEESVQPGAVVKRGDPMGTFLFGGSDIVMVFQQQVELTLLVPEDGTGSYAHLLMGEPYAALTLR